MTPLQTRIHQSLEGFVVSYTNDAASKLGYETPTAAQLLHSLEWMQNLAESAARAYYAESVLYHTERGIELLVALEEQVGQLTHALLNDNLRGGSTSAFHNATEGAKRAAAATFLRDAKRWVRELREENEKKNDQGH